MKILAIDPGTTKSAFVVYDSLSKQIELHGHVANADLEEMIGSDFSPLDSYRIRHCAIEMIQSFGMAVGREVFETVYWIGRLARAWDSFQALTHQQLPSVRIYRGDIKQHLCNSVRAKDANIRQALMDRFGGERATSIGTKKNPGPLYGIASDRWSALAVAVTYADRLGALTKSEAA